MPHPSMLRLLTRTQLDDVAYDRCIAESPDRIVYAFSWYLDAVSPGWKCLVDGDYETVMPLPVRQRYGVEAIVQPLFCHQLGVFGRHETPDEGVLRAFLFALRQHFRYVPSYQLHAGNASHLPDSFVRMTNYVLDLNAPYGQLRRHYSSGRRYDLRNPLPTEWTLEQTDDLTPLFRLFLQHNTNAIGRIDPTAQATLQRLTLALQARQQVRIYAASRQGKIEAGNLFVLDASRIVHLFSAASPAGRLSNARLLILDSLIQEYAGRPVLLDFESPEVSSHAAFYRRFGATAEPYARLSINTLPLGVRAVQALKKHVHRLISR